MKTSRSRPRPSPEEDPDRLRDFAQSPIEIDIGPLVSAIAENKAVTLVGAGASIPAGLPGWGQFLDKCLRRAQQTTPAPETWAFTERKLKEGDFLMAAELLQLGLNGQVEKYIWDEFSAAVKPTPIHQAIARMPFSLAITTNYDRLLEAAFNTPTTLTWRSPEGLFRAVKDGRFAVVKTHGTVGDGSSLVLTKTQYRDLIHLNEAFNSCLRALLCYKSFLFVGYSLSDHDLLGLMDEARLLHGREFGPHYAILFEDNVDQHFLRFLEESYNIHAIICRQPRNSDGTLTKNPGDWRTKAVVDVLRALAGKVAECREPSFPSPRLEGELFCLPDTCATLLDQAIELTGSLRGEVALIQREHFQALHTYAEACQGKAKAYKWPDQPPGPVPHNGVVGSLFLRSGEHRNYVYLPNTSQSKSALHERDLDDAKYRECDTRVKSELACTILADGQRAGVINVESDLENAYTYEHLQVLRRCAERLGNAYLEAKRRKTAAKALEHYTSNPAIFSSVINKSRFLKSMSICYILWQIDHNSGKLVAHWDRTDPRMPANGVLEYTFDETSLARTVAKTGRRVVIENVEAELGSATCRLSPKGCDMFNIKGPIAAIPIQCMGNQAAVLVAWSADPKLQTSLSSRGGMMNFKIAAERIHRVAHLIANEPPSSGLHAGSAGKSRAEKFIDLINETLKPYDDGQDWSKMMLEETAFRSHTMDALLKCLLHESVGIGRVRLWMARNIHSIEHEQAEFTCIRSLTNADCTFPGKPAENAYINILSAESDPFCHYTVTRWKEDPYARHQDAGMFGTVDLNSDALDKAENGSWIVGPITFRTPLKPSLLGFVSADNHKPVLRHGVIKSEDMFIDEAERAFQRAVVDIITHLLGPLLYHEILHTPVKPAKP